MKKFDSSVKRALVLIEDAGFKVDEYIEGGEVCGYECETWTGRIGINMHMFIDLRATSYADGVTAANIAHEVIDIYEGFDAGEEAVAHWNVWPELHRFGLGEVLKAMEEYEETLHDLAVELSEGGIYA